MPDNTPRRLRLDLNTGGELAIFNAVQEVERMGADPRLTEVSEMLLKAKNLLSDYVDSEIDKDHCAK